MMALVTISQAQQWAHNTAAPYIHQPLSEADEDPMEGKIPLGKDEIPRSVMRAFQTGPYQHMAIVQVFRLQDQALNNTMLDEDMEDPFFTESPLFLYEFRLEYEGKQFCLYFTPDGHLYENTQSV
ncbi:MAG: hypothetical protein RIG62_15145 [Cyclobacteriaceae bacterium]